MNEADLCRLNQQTSRIIYFYTIFYAPCNSLVLKFTKLKCKYCNYDIMSFFIYDFDLNGQKEHNLF